MVPLFALSLSHCRQQIPMASPDQTHAKAYQKTKQNKQQQHLFLLSQLQHIINIKPHIDYASVVWDGCGEVHLKTTTTELPTSKGRQIIPS